jgi:hypothetical protein
MVTMMTKSEHYLHNLLVERLITPHFRDQFDSFLPRIVVSELLSGYIKNSNTINSSLEIDSRFYFIGVYLNARVSGSTRLIRYIGDKPFIKVVKEKYSAFYDIYGRFICRE